jgi:spore maturation protein CgeB
MTYRVLFIAALHHPEQLQRELAQVAPGAVPPLFPTSMGQHFWERAMRRRGYALAVFWRNLPGYGGDLRQLKAQRHQQRLTPGKIVQGALRRLPPALNPDLRRRNQNLLRQARAFQPDIVWLVGDNTVVYAETLAQLKAETGCTLIYASGTSPIVFSHAIEREAARLYDLVLVNDYYHGMQWLELGARRMVCLPIAAIDPDFHHPVALPAAEYARYACDVGFVGTLVPHNLYSERVRALEALRDTDLDLGVWSVHEVPPTLRPFLRGAALGEQMFRVLNACKISLNIHGDFMRYGGNMRLFEAAAVGAFQLSDDRPGIATWFTPGEHLALFSDPADLRDKVAYYLAHPAEREQMAQAARAHVVAHHTYDQRLNTVATLLAELRA